MEKKTYYMILGVPRTESTSGIRAAFRDLAKRLHPDVAGQEQTRAFQEVAEAYAVLSDPEGRRAYNHKLRADEGQRLGAQPMVREAVSIFAHPNRIRPSFEAMYQRFQRNFTGLGVPKSERLEGLNVEVLLDPIEVVHGCVVPVSLPAFGPCPRCDGSGRDWLLVCGSCQGQGVVERDEVVGVQVPPLTPAGSVIEVHLSELGIHNFVLRVHVLHQGVAR
jgi:molecular chaperone DnaJ